MIGNSVSCVLFSTGNKRVTLVVLQVSPNMIFAGAGTLPWSDFILPLR